MYNKKAESRTKLAVSSSYRLCKTDNGRKIPSFAIILCMQTPFYVVRSMYTFMHTKPTSAAHIVPCILACMFTRQTPPADVLNLTVSKYFLQKADNISLMVFFQYLFQEEKTVGALHSIHRPRTCLTFSSHSRPRVWPKTLMDSSANFKLLPKRHIFFDLVIRFITNSHVQAVSVYENDHRILHLHFFSI